MLPTQPHSIRRQIVEVAVAGSESDALALQAKLTAVCTQTLMPVIEQALDRCCPANGVLRIDRLEIDAGSIELGRLEQDLPALLQRGLDQALRAHLAGRVDDDGSVSAAQHVSTMQAMDEALAYFLACGTLPPSLHLAKGEPFEATLLALWREAAAMAATLAPALIRSLKSMAALERLGGQFSVRFQTALVARLLGAPASVLQASLRRVRAAAVPAELAHCERLLCQAAVVRALRGGEGDVETLLRDALARAQPASKAHLRFAALLPGTLAPPTRNARADQDTSPAEAPNVAPSKQLASHPELVEGQGIYVDNAGLVLLHPFLSRMFEALGVSEGEDLLQPERALVLLHFLACGQTEAPEYVLALPKLLCQLPLTSHVDSGVVLSAAEQEEAQAVLEAVIKHWESLRNTSADGLRGAFLLRPGRLTERAGEWLLQVETQTADILMADLPWGVSAVRLPWMDRILWVEWA